MDLAIATVKSIRDAVQSKSLSAVEVTSFFIERINRLDSQLNSFVTVNDRALEEAKSVDAKIAKGSEVGPLAGVPIALKDLFCTEGLRTTACSKVLENFTPPYSASVVERLKGAGAVILGKTSLDEFGMGSSNENSAFGPVRNPWNIEHVPGGSSGGSAAALAARLTPAAMGTDTGGSIRQPASFCGLYGIKPTYGRVSRYGIISYASSLDQAGPMAHSTEDCAILLETISGYCELDSTTARIEVPTWSDSLNKNNEASLKGCRIGIPKEYLNEHLDPDVMRITQNAIDRLKMSGAEIVEVSLSLVKYAVQVYYLIATSEASSNLARYDGVRFGYRSDDSKEAVQDLEDFYSRNRGEAFGTEVKRRIMIGTHALSSGFYDAYYQKASQVRRLIRDEFIEAFQKCDVLLSPVSATPAFKLGNQSRNPLTMYLNDVYTTSTNLAGLPGMAVPSGFSADGLPIGVQLTAKHFDEQRIFDVSLVLERTASFDKRVPHVI